MQTAKISSETQLPVYNIKAVSRLIGLLPVTLRAWERRYGLPSPRRGSQGYRLYSEYDLRTLRWLKSQLESGMNIGRAVEYLNELRQTGRDPAQDNGLAEQQRSISIQSMADQFESALMAYNDTEAGEVLQRAFALYPMERVLSDLFEPTLIHIGERWHNGEIPIAAEHFATQFCTQYLLGMLNASAQPSHPGVIAAACAPGETHQVGLIMVVILLRWRGWPVKYFGSDLKLDRLEETLNSIQPKAVLFSATRMETARQLERLPDVLHRLSIPIPRVILGGKAFLDFRLPEEIAAEYIQATPSDAVDRIEKIMLEATHPRRQRQRKPAPALPEYSRMHGVI